jgi:hypothetical protein
MWVENGGRKYSKEVLDNAYHLWFNSQSEKRIVSRGPFRHSLPMAEERRAIPGG